MTPRFTLNYKFYRRIANAIGFSDLATTARRVLVFLANSYDLLLVKFGSPVASSSRGASLKSAVSHVVCLCAEKQMVRPNARRIVAAVKHAHALRNRAVPECPRKPVGRYLFPLVGGHSVAPRFRWPRPAVAFRFIQLSPKPPRRKPLLLGSAGVAAKFTIWLCGLKNDVTVRTSKCYFVFSHCGTLLRRVAFWSGSFDVSRIVRAASILALLVGFAGVNSAQTLVPVTEELPDDQFIVIRNGKEYRALNADKIRELLKMKIDLEAAERIASEFRIQIKEAVLQRDLAAARESLQKQKAESFEKDFNRAREDAARFQSLFMSERELRREAQEFAPRGNVTGKWAKVFDFLNSQPVQLTVKYGIPFLNTVRCQR